MRYYDTFFRRSERENEKKVKKKKTSPVVLRANKRIGIHIHD